MRTNLWESIVFALWESIGFAHESLDLITNGDSDDCQMVGPTNGHSTPSLMGMALLKCLHACQASQKSIVIQLCQRRHDQCCLQAGTASVTGTQASPRQKEFLTPSNCSFISGMAMMDLKDFQHRTFHFCF